MNSRILTVPNQLTFLRLAFLPFFIIAIKYDSYGVALAILLVAGFTRRARRIAGPRPESENSARRLSRSHRGQAAALFFLFRAGAEGKNRHGGWRSWFWAATFCCWWLAPRFCSPSATVRFRPASGERPPRSSRFCWCFWCCCWRFGITTRCILRGTVCGYWSQRWSMISGFHYSITVSRRLARGS